MKYFDEIDNLLISNLKKSLILIKQNIKNFLLIIFLDLLFLFLYGFFSSAVFTKVAEYFYALSSKALENPSEFGASFLFLGFYNALREQADSSGPVRNIVFLILIFILSVYVLYSFIQGLCWKLSHDIAVKKTTTYEYIKSFAKINIPWFIIFVIYQIIVLILGFRNVISQRFYRTTSNAEIIFSAVFLTIVFYFIFISYSLTEKRKFKEIFKKTFSIGIKKIKYSLPAYILVLLVFFIINYALIMSFYMNQYAPVVLGFILAIPAFAWARVYVNMVVGEIEKGN